MRSRARCARALVMLSLGACSFAPSGEGVIGAGDAAADGAGVDPDAGVGLDAGVGSDGAPATDATPLDAPAVSVDARPDCPVAYTLSVGTSRYLRHSGADTIGGARTDCGDDLPGRTGVASFENSGDLATVLSGIGASGSDQLWVGARCEFGMFGCSGASSWTWDTGAGVSAALWLTGEPDNPFTELSAMVAKVGGNWRLLSTGTVPIESHPYLCECAE